MPNASERVRPPRSPSAPFPPEHPRVTGHRMIDRQRPRLHLLGWFHQGKRHSMSSSMPGGRGYFPTTHWSEVAAAGQTDPELKREALGRLVMKYLPALQAHLVWKGIARQEAEDLVQDFVAGKVVEKGLIAGADRQLGRFRTYLLTALTVSWPINSVTGFRRNAIPRTQRWWTSRIAPPPPPHGRPPRLPTLSRQPGLDSWFMKHWRE